MLVRLQSFSECVKIEASRVQPSIEAARVRAVSEIIPAVLEALWRVGAVDVLAVPARRGAQWHVSAVVQHPANEHSVVSHLESVPHSIHSTAAW
jgi:hypothetical protein